MGKYCFILNPTAGKGRGKGYKEKIENYEKKTKNEFKIVETEYPGHGEILSREACGQGFTHIISVGGDGTLFEVVNGAYGKEVSIGLIPCGTGNDFSRTINLPAKLEEQLDVIHGKRTKKMDLGKANDSYFINVFSFGIDALITRETQKIKRYLPGTFAYILATIKMLMIYKPVEINLKSESRVFNGKVMLVALGKGEYYGGGMRITPGARVDSGDFQVCIVKALKKITFLKLFPMVFKGNHVYRQEVEVFRAKKVSVESSERMLLNADGDIIGECPVEIDLLPQSIKIIVP